MNYAALDIGTNAVLLLIMKEKGRLEELCDLSTITRLGEGLLGSGTLNQSAIARTIEALENYAAVIAENHVDSLLCFGTSAVREAKNRDDFVAMVRNRTGLEVDVFSECQEAYYTYLSVQRDPLVGKEDLLIVDIGGGSTEIITGRAGRFFDYVSLPVGTVKLTELFIRHDPPLSEELEEVRSFVRQKLSARNAQNSPTIIGMAGTMTTLAAMEIGLHVFDKERIHGLSLTRDTFDRWIARLSRMSLAERKTISGMEPGREDVLLQGIILMREIMRFYGAENVAVSTAVARYGVIYGAIGGAQVHRVKI